MATTAKFGTKTFDVTSKKIYTPDGLTYSESLSTEEVEVSGKKPKLNIKGIGLKELSFDVILDARFVTVETEISWWDKKLLSKKSESFSLGKTTLGKFYLTEVQKSNIIVGKNGKFAKCKMSLTFKEDGASANSSSSTNKSNTVKNSSSSSSKKNIKVGTYIKPKSGTRWYYTAAGALNRTGISGKAYNQKLRVTYIYQNGRAINPQGLGWMIPADVDVV